MSTPAEPPTVAIIGGGFSGTMVAAGLVRTLPAGSTVVRFERSADRVGRGVAYATGDEHHQLNVPAARMSALPDDPDSFVRWLGEHAPEHAEPAGFAPRRVYGDYLRDVLEHAVLARPDVHVRTVVDEIVSVDAEPHGSRGHGSGGHGSGGHGSGAVVVGAGSGPVRADHVVLAVGSLPTTPRWPVPLLDAWDPSALEVVRTDQPVLIVGCGLSAVDLVLTRARAGCGSPLHLLSRSGLLPRPHGPAPAASSTPWLDELRAAPTLAGALATVRKAAGADEPGWRSVMDSLRPLTPSLWAGLTAADRERFLRLLRRQWDVHRHRCPADNRAVLDELCADGRLEVHRGRLVGLDGRSAPVRATIGTTAGPTTLTVAAVIDATGTANRLDAAAGPLWASLSAAGLCRPGPCGLGLDTDDDGRVVAADGTTVSWLSTLGPTRQGTRWESTAVPELRVQAAALAARIAGTTAA